MPAIYPQNKCQEHRRPWLMKNSLCVWQLLSIACRGHQFSPSPLQNHPPHPSLMLSMGQSPAAHGGAPLVPGSAKWAATERCAELRPGTAGWWQRQTLPARGHSGSLRPKSWGWAPAPCRASRARCSLNAVGCFYLCYVHKVVLKRFQLIEGLGKESRVPAVTTSEPTVSHWFKRRLHQSTIPAAGHFSSFRDLPPCLCQGQTWRMLQIQTHCDTLSVARQLVGCACRGSASPGWLKNCCSTTYPGLTWWAMNTDVEKFGVK